MEPLLKLLEENALTSPEILAKRLNRPVDQIIKDIKRLEDEKVILAYKAIVDDEKANRQTVSAVIEVRITPERDGGFNRLAARISKYPEVTSCFLMSGGYDLLVFVEGQSLKQVATFVSEKLSTIHGVLSTATHFMLKTYKEQNVLLAGEDHDERLKVSP
ncbi:MAG: AsnC family transcriptional regulator [Verrucomicrobia bacterium Tous-C9LFEB]|nr:MAG: AsnC family transcriptional regulator [Verrucomicrobia bacterium Tous-C9LFEB]